MYAQSKQESASSDIGRINSTKFDHYLRLYNDFVWWSLSLGNYENKILFDRRWVKRIDMWCCGLTVQRPR
ncbi:hypothetical protein THF1A12_320089 [Vibrio jasicida]|uniref:Uncharacterized protein n=1 Tax=Vibrio jasicida TaxID=766224 RepID=A0AAU9QRK9_9VIBR|nr:hypothetical protein THF1A12_320089 [Vibrio jasicida]